MGVNFSKSSHIIFFGGIIPALSWFASSWFFILLPAWPNWLEGLSPLAVYGIIFLLFDKFLWKLEIFRILKIVSFPDLNGRWEGTQRSTFKKDGKNVEVATCLEIKQNFSSVVVKGYYEKSGSDSVVATFKEINGETFLYYTYDNDPNTLKAGTMQSHKGTAKIKLLAQESKIHGFYWNSIGNQGDMFLDLKNRVLLGKL